MLYKYKVLLFWGLDMQMLNIVIGYHKPLLGSLILALEVPCDLWFLVGINSTHHLEFIPALC